ncbi:Stk1 family PASTA domain-containing Ser/Thr kinase [Raineyella sp. LH-20]|uniref:Stk1 family PASTA domain-containing Ser/Thr kinase n=1 Tax=Raineyella sp. LH-20 TaxID=3081204 RepID=UPI002953F8E0|nr:Stk1 family PASTA domain-containing Ser/Thr kinase [Raineyella sp. LH-20]WOP19771.1 Stk1 family PASTA domain-containing Ser/Thr kinase [Raineyella sp. LH-20]
MDIQPTILGGRYQLGPTLGRGGMAEVNRARDLRLQREVAIKRLRIDLASDPTFQARFRREAHSAAGLNHPNIVAVYDTDEQHDPVSGQVVPYIVMELVEGRTLRQVMNSGEAFTSERALEITQGVLDALGYSHRAGIVHRDIKPGNVMLTDLGGQVKVMDFGIARAVADTQATMTQTAAVIGTAQYLSPEQARGEKVGFRSDLYSTGCLLYELLTGRPPFVGDSPVSVAYQHVREHAAAPSAIVPTISPSIDAVVLKALEKDPDRRYQNAREFHDDIARVLAGQAPLALAGAVAAPTAAMTATAVGGMAPVEAAMPTRAMGALPQGEEAALATSPQRAMVDPDADEADDLARRRRRRNIWIVVAAVLVVLLTGGGIFAANGGLTPKQPVPDVRGKTQVVAEELIKAQGLTSTVNVTEGPAGPTVGTVTAQDPPGGTRLANGGVVTLTVNGGPSTTAIPDGLVGQQLSKVQSQLKSAGFTNVTTVAAESSRPANEVLSINPPSGSKVVPDAPIQVTYASGKVTMPDWSGFNRQAVMTDAAGIGLTNVTFTEQASNAAVGTVISQSPAAGSKVSRDAAITVILAKAPQATPPPTSGGPSTPTTTPASPASDTPAGRDKGNG